MVPFLNVKELSAHLSTVKIDGDAIQDMKMLPGQASMLFFVATNCLVVLTDFDSIYESFSCRKELVPRSTHPWHLQFNRHFECVDKLLDNRLINGANGEVVVG